MLLACLALIVGPGDAPRETWTSCEEVYALAKFDDRLYAGTSGGVLVYSAEAGWGFTEPRLDRPIFSLDPSSRALSAFGPYGDFTWNGREWKEAISHSYPVRSTTLPSETPTSGKAEWDEATGCVKDQRTGKDFGRPGRGKLYSLFDAQRGLVAGTSDGLWVYKNDEWIREALPSDSPMPRLHGLAAAGRRGWIAGGLGGLAIGRPGNWEKLNDRPVRRIFSQGREVWVIYGDGTVDKMTPEADVWQHDVLYGAVKRPWASMIAAGDDGLLIGGQAGWVEKTSRGQVEVRPEWFSADVVTAMADWKNQLVVAGQKTGLHLRAGKKWTHFNAAHGLNDLWITAIHEFKGRLWIATATQGLYSTDGRTIRQEGSPEPKVTTLLVVNGILVIGTMQGGFRLGSSGWIPMGVRAETTSLVAASKGIWVTSPYSAQRFDLGS